MNPYRWLFLLILFVISCAPSMAWAKITIQAQTAVDIELTGFDGLDDLVLFQDEINQGSNQVINTPYRGLALLKFPQGQSYPLIIGDSPIALKIDEPSKPPVFEAGTENDYFYTLLAGAKPDGDKKYPFANLMIRAKNLLEASYGIKTREELPARKNEFLDFVGSNYGSLKNSDMILRLIGQSFMMHEYVSYHVEGEPATAIQQKYQEEVIAAVDGWLKVLSRHLPGNEIINACVAYYYDRGMVSMASLIIDRFPDDAYCPGEADVSIIFSDDLAVIDSQKMSQGTLADLKGEKTIALVAADCPVSMVVAVAKARELAKQTAASPLIVAPLQELNETHLAMSKMIRDEKMLFIDDETWQRMKPEIRPRLPLFFGEESVTRGM